MFTVSFRDLRPCRLGQKSNRDDVLASFHSSFSFFSPRVRVCACARSRALFLFCCSFHGEPWQRAAERSRSPARAPVLRKATAEGKVFGGGLIRIECLRPNYRLNARQLERDPNGRGEKHALAAPIFHLFVFLPMRRERGGLARCLQAATTPPPQTFLPCRTFRIFGRG